MIIFERRNIEAVECVLYKIGLEVDYIDRNEFEVGRTFRPDTASTCCLGVSSTRSDTAGTCYP